MNDRTLLARLRGGPIATFSEGWITFYGRGMVVSILITLALGFLVTPLVKSLLGPMSAFVILVIGIWFAVSCGLRAKRPDV